MIHKKLVKPNSLTEIIAGESRYIKVINCQTDLRMTVYKAGGGEVLSTEVRSGFDVTLPEFHSVVMQSEQEQKIEIWVSKNKLGYEAPTKGGNSNSSGLIEHFGGVQKALPFERNRVAVTLYSDSEPFWYGGEGVTVENGIPVRAGVAHRVEGAGELHIAINKSPSFEMGDYKGVLDNQIDGVDYGVTAGSYNCKTTAAAMYFTESMINDSSDEHTLLRVVEDRVERINPIKKNVVDIYVKDFEKDIVGVLYSDGQIEVYESGVLIETIATLLYVYNWRSLSWNGVEWCAYAAGQGMRSVSNPDVKIFDLANGFTVSSFFYDEHSSRWLAVGGGGGKYAIMDITNFTGVFDDVGAMVKPWGVLDSNMSFVRVEKNDKYIALNQSNGYSVIVDRQNDRINTRQGLSGAFLILQGSLIYSVSKDGQSVSYDGGVSFTVTGNNTYTIDKAIGGFGAFIGNTFILRSGIKDENGLYKIRAYDVKTIKAKAFANIRMLKEVV